MRHRHTSLAPLLSVGLILACTTGTACDAERAPPVSTPSGVLPTGVLDRTITFHTDGSVGLEGRITLFYELGNPVQSFGVRGLHIDEPGTHAWIVDAVGYSEGPVNPDAPSGAIVAGVASFEAHADEAGSMTTVLGEMPSVPLGTVVLDVVLNGREKTLVPGLNQQTVVADVCEAPPLDPVAISLDASLAWSTATLPNVVVDAVDVAADADGRAYLLGSFYGGGEDVGARLFTMADGHVGSVAELPTNTAALAPGEGAGPTVAMRTHPFAGATAITVSRRDVALSEVWSRSIGAPTDVGVAAIATSGGRVLAGMTVAPPLTIDGAVVTTADADPEQLLVFDADSGALLASKGGVHALRAEALAGGAFVVATDDGSGAFTRVLEADLTERWKVEGTGAIATTPDGRVFLGIDGEVRIFAADGAPLGVIPAASGASFAPLDDGSLLVQRLDGVARVWPDGHAKWTTLPAAEVGWCTATPPFLVTRVDGGAILATRPKTPQDGSSAGRAIVARLEAPK